MVKPLLYSQVQVAAILNVSTASVRTALEEGAPGVVFAGSKGRPAQIDFSQFYQWWLARALARAAVEPQKELSLQDKETEVDIRLKELRFAREGDELIATTDARRVVRDVFQTVATVLAEMPEREAHRLVQLTEMADAVAALTAIATGLQAELRNPERWIIDDDDPTTPADAEPVADA